MSLKDTNTRHLFVLKMFRTAGQWAPIAMGLAVPDACLQVVSKLVSQARRPVRDGVRSCGPADGELCDATDSQSSEDPMMRTLLQLGCAAARSRKPVALLHAAHHK